MKQGWEIKKLQEVCDFKSGNTIDNKLEKSDGEVIYAKVGDMNLEGNEDYITLSSRYVDLKSINPNQIIPVGSIIFPKRGGAIATNKKRRIIKPTIVDLNTMALVPSKNIDKDYLFFWFKQIDLSDLSNGTSIPQINNYSFDDVYIPYPKSLPEQQRIVAILDEAFAAIAKAKANAETNLKNSKELFESYLQGVFETKGEGWEENILKDVCELKSGTTISPSLERTEGDVLYTKVGDMNLPDNEVEINTSSRFVNSQEIKVNQIIPEGAIIFPKRGGAIATNKKRKIVKPTIVDLNTMAIIPSMKIDKDYLFHWFKLIDLNSISNGTSIPQINNYSFDEVYIPYPKSLKQQQTIVQKLDALSLETKKLEAIYQQKINDLEELKKSVLQKAFSGELKGKLVAV